jgi:hypothetical protein
MGALSGLSFSQSDLKADPQRHRDLGEQRDPERMHGEGDAWQT